MKFRLDNLPGMIRKIYLKIREQLEDKNHPIIWIIAQFQIAFRHNIEERNAEIQRMHESSSMPDRYGGMHHLSSNPAADTMQDSYAINRGSSIIQKRSFSDTTHEFMNNSLYEQRNTVNDPDIMIRSSREDNKAAAGGFIREAREGIGSGSGQTGPQASSHALNDSA